MLNKAQHASLSGDNENNSAEQVANGLWLVLAGVLFYALVHVGIRLLKSNVLGEDDVLANVLSQELALGYDTHPRQPPLYHWVLWGVQQVTGPSLQSFLLIKYAALVGTVVFLYLSALRVLKSHIFAALSVEALALIYSISWRFHEGFTHQVLAMLAVAATLYVFLRLQDRQRWLDYVVFAIVVGLGLLTERVYAVFLFALLSAALLQPGLRGVVLNLRMMLVVVIAGLITSPYLYWLFSDANRLADWLRPGAQDLKGYLRGVIDAVRGPLFYLSPLIVFVPIMFPGWLTTAWKNMRAARNESEDGDLMQLLWHVVLISFVVSIIGALVLRLGKQPIHAFMVLYITSVIWLFGIVRDTDGSLARVKRFALLALVIAFVALTARLANLYVMDPACKKCRWGIPYATLAETMKREGYDGRVLLTADVELAGNLRQQFPKSQIVLLGTPAYAPPGFDKENKTKPQAYVWRQNFREHELIKALPNGQNAQDAKTLTVPWQHLWRPTGYRMTTWRMLLTD